MDYKDKIMEEFIRLFMQKSCKDISVDEIAENLGISKRTIYENFNSKAEIIKQTLQHYQTIFKNETLDIKNKETNPLRQILAICFAIIHNAQQITINKLLVLKKHYPEIAEELIEDHVEFMRKVLLNSYCEAQHEGYIFKEVKPEFLLALLVGGEKDPGQKTLHFMGQDFDTIELFKVHLFTIIRGVATLKGVEVCDAYHKEVKLKK